MSLTKSDLNDLEAWINKSFNKRECKNFVSKKFQDHVKRKYGLKLISQDGISRTVYKKPYAREVVKFSYFKHNIVENCTYHYYKDTNVGPVLAKAKEISDTGLVFTQEYISHHLPGHNSDQYFYEDTYMGNEFADLRYFVCSLFDEEEPDDLQEDFHESNLRYDNQGNVKIIDYASIAEEFSEAYYITKAKSTSDKIRAAVNKGLKHLNPTRQPVTFSYNGDLTLRIGDNEVSVNLKKPADYKSQFVGDYW